MHPRLFRPLAILGFLGCAVLLLGWHLDRLPWRFASYGSETRYCGENGPSLSVESLTELYEGHRLHLLRDYDPAADERELGYRSVANPTSRGNGTDLAKYIGRLRSIVQTAWSVDSPYREPLLDAVKRMQDHIPTLSAVSSPSDPEPNPPSHLPKSIHTTNKSKDPSSLPSFFSHWARLHKPGDKWSVTVYDDEAIEGFFTDVMDGRRGEEGDKGERDLDVIKEWGQLRKPVFKADIFRYLKLLLHGGIYTDSDTAPVAPAETWGHSYKSIISPELGAIRTILKTSLAYQHLSNQSPDPPPPSNADSPFYDDPVSYKAPILDEGINLVVAIEVDAVSLNMGDDWRDFGMSRKLQICQWTLMAKPFHPVFLDALETIFARAKGDRERLEDGEITEDDLPSALEFTGPGPFTDAVMRYLLFQYGVMPRDLIGKTESTRIGDVLILPTYSFSQPLPQFSHAETGAVYHEYKGRWRDHKEEKQASEEPAVS